MNLEQLVSITSVGAFLVTLISLAFSAKKYLDQREKEQNTERFNTYHNLVHAISSGTFKDSDMKLTSQIAFIYELRNYPEYSSITHTILNALREQWSEGENPRRYDLLKEAIDETLANI